MDRLSTQFVSNIASQKIVEKFRLDPTQMIFISAFISTGLSQFDYNLHTTYLFGLSIISGILFFSHLLWKKVKKPNSVEYCRTLIFDEKIFSLIRFMMRKHPEFWSTNYDLEVGNPFYRQLKYWIPLEDVPVHFDDKLHNVKGFFVVKQFEPPRGFKNTDDTKENEAVRCVELCIEKGCNINGDTYTDKLEKYEWKVSESETGMELLMIKIIHDEKDKPKNHIVTMYTGSKDSTEQRYKDYMLSYFSEHRDRLWTLVKNIHYHPEKFRAFGQEARINMLFHGPPGTGKSAFAYRLAVSLGRHIVSLDITSMIDKKLDIYQIIQKASIDGVYKKPKEYIVLLEEFDITVMYLHNKKKKKETPKLQTYVNANANVHEGTAIEPKDREFELEDLLEILQGPVPIPGSIIIATTNKYKEMNELCPALFRPGRLTPVEFGYMTWDSLQEMCRYYFQKELSLPPTKIIIPTSDIIENALSATLYGEDGFKMFENFIQSKMKVAE